MIRVSGCVSKKQKENISISASKESHKPICFPFQVIFAGSIHNRATGSCPQVTPPARPCPPTTPAHHGLPPTSSAYSGLSQLIARTFTLRTSSQEMSPGAFHAVGQGGDGLGQRGRPTSSSILLPQENIYPNKLLPDSPCRAL